MIKATIKVKTLGEKLSWLREKRGLRQNQVAKDLGISVPNVSKIERDLVTINMARLYQLADYYQVNVGSLLLENEPSAVFGNERIKELEDEIKAYQVKLMELQSKLLACMEFKNIIALGDKIS